jgi:hypothetical protein
MTHLVEALADKYPGLEFALNADNEIIDWRSKDVKKPSKTACKKILKEYIKANQYKKDRKAAYPSIEDQLDKIYHEGVSEWRKSISKIKDKYPKADKDE